MQELRRFALLPLAVLSFTLAAFAQHTDISLEGPWIMYVDNVIQDWPVLVIISPGKISDDQNPGYYHSLSMDSGDGFPLSRPGSYCLTFGGTCTPEPPCHKVAHPKCATTIDQDGYPSSVPALKVSVGQGWDWAHKYQSPFYATAFILPMPDYYKTDAGWFMRFSTAFDVTGKNYKVYDGHSKYASGIILHYENGPTTFAISDCSPGPGIKLDFKGGKNPCVPQAGTNFDDIGTLHIALRSPEMGDSCDAHVRRGYPLTMKLLGGDNTAIQAVDLAHGYKDVSHLIPNYDDDLQSFNEKGKTGKRRCLDEDPQGQGPSAPPGAPAALAAAMPMGFQKPEQVQSTLSVDVVDAIVTDDANVGEVLKDPLISNSTIQLGAALDQLREATKSLNQSYPRFSQTRWIHDLAIHTKDQLQLIPATDLKVLNSKVPTLTADLQKAADTTFTKTGNDCKAAIMYGTSQ
jgi:hypothetical protein